MTARAAVVDVLRGPRVAAMCLALAADALAVGIGAAVPLGWLFGLGVVASYLAEVYLKRRLGALATILHRVGLGITQRFVLRELALLLFLARVGAPAWDLVVVTGLLWNLHALRGLYTALSIRVSGLRRLPIVSRNIDLSELGIADARHPLARGDYTTAFLLLDAPVMLLSCLAGTGRSVPLLVPATVASLLAALAAVGHLALHWARARRMPSRARVLEVVRRQAVAYRPEVILYFSGSGSSMYQLHMWLSTAEALTKRVLVVMRERSNVGRLSPTALPVVCIPSAVDLMNFELPDVRVALFVANVGKNIHLLRVPGIKHVFIGHGDSDKAASFNPFTKVYDEVWVAGPAGRERYARAQVGVRDEEIVEVGRPQLAAIQPAVPREPEWVPTVIYAPTWEGWTADPYHTSLLLMGPRILQRLLERERPVRIVYKPHPLTGTRSLEAARAHRQLVSMLEADNARRAADPRWQDAPDAERDEARERLAGADEQLRRNPWSNPGGEADEAQRSRDLGRPDHAALEARDRAAEVWHEAYWAAQEPWRHRVVPGSRPTLYSCFDASDLMVADISSVVADFLASAKPYLVTNPAGVPDADFREQYGSAAAAYLVAPDCANLDELVDLAYGEDPLAHARAALATHLLGLDPRRSLERFDAALDSLADRARAQPSADRLEFGFDPEPGEEELGQPGDGVTAGSDERGAAPPEDDEEVTIDLTGRRAVGAG